MTKCQKREAEGTNNQTKTFKNAILKQNKKAFDGQDSKSPAKKGEEVIYQAKSNRKNSDTGGNT